MKPPWESENTAWFWGSACIPAILLAVILGVASASEPQSTGSVTNIQVAGLATVVLATAVDSTGAVTGVTTDYADVVRCVAVFSGSDNANDADIEGTVDGTNWHTIDTADPNGIAVEIFADTSGPWSSMRANVVALGAGVNVTITCLATLRQ